MSTIFPGSASVGQVFNGYTFDGTVWNINGIDLTTNYLEESSASATYLTQVNASSTYQPIVANVSNTEIGYLDGVTSGIQSQIDSKLSASSASTTYLTQASASTTYQAKVANVDDIEIGYLNNASANIQTQLNAKANLSGATFSGNIIAPEVRATAKLVGQTVGGDEGGEILLGKAATNTTLTGDGVTIDVYQNKLRIFEQGGNARGGYIDISKLSDGVGTNLTPGVVLAKTQVVGSGVTSVVVNDAFSAAYDNYEVLWTGGTMTSSSGDSQLTLYLGNSNTGYKNILRYSNGSAMSVALQENAAQWNWVGGGSTGSGLLQIKLYAPYLSVHTRMSSTAYNSWNNVYFGTADGVHTVSSSYTGFTVNVSGTGTMSGGTIRVYGYNNG